MSFTFQERDPHDDEQPQQILHNPNRQEPVDDGVVVVYGSTFTYDEELPPEMTTKFGKVAIEVAKLQKRIKDDADFANQNTKKEEQDQREEAPKAPPKPSYTKHDMKRARMLLASVLNAVTVEEARKAIRMFSGSLDEYKIAPSSSNSSAVSISPYIQAVLEAGGTVSMVVVLEKWYTKSEECSLLAMGGLATLVISDPSSAFTIASIGAIDTIFQVVQQYPKSQMVSSDAIEVLLSLAGQTATRPLVSSKECRGLVKTAMAHFPTDEDIQLEGCEYFLEIGKLDGIKEDLLREKKLGKLLGQAQDQFRDDVSQRAVQWYSS
ncbi:MAG: hypothetical protein SGBAC_005545 [Bacillariaceae sp.]